MERRYSPSIRNRTADLELGRERWGARERAPSTVDMDAIKGGGSWDPATEPNGT